MDVVSLIALGVLVVIFLVLFTSRRAPSAAQADGESVSADGGSLETRVAAHVRALDGPGVDDAERRLLSIGAPVIPHLLRHLEQVDVEPLAISPAQQVAVESLLADFGPQTFLQTRRFLRRVHRVSPLFPAVIRVLARIGPPLLVDLIDAADDVPFALLAPLVAELWTEIPPDELVALLASAEDATTLTVAALPLLSREPDLMRRLEARASSDGARLDDVLARTHAGAQEGREPPPLPPRELDEDSLGDALDELDALVADEVATEALVLQLAHHLDDPRVHERFIRLVEALTPHASLALRELARSGVHTLQPLVNRLLRAPSARAVDIVHLRSTLALRPEPTVQALSMALRSETPRVVLRAVEVLVSQPVSEHLLDFLKALGRHRYSPLEASLATPILADWSDATVDTVVEATRHEDREVQLSAVELLGFYGDARHVNPLLELWGRYHYLDDVILNAVELLGVAAIPALRRRTEALANPDAPYVLERRLELLELLAADRGAGFDSDDAQKSTRSA